MSRNKNYIFCIVILLLGLVFFFQEKQKVVPSDTIKVTTSVYPLAEFVRAIGKEKVEVWFLVPPGTEPHEFSPTPQDRVLMEQSHVFVFVGAGFEPWAERILPDIQGIVTIEASQGLPLLSSDGFFDPHVLADPVLVQNIVDTITQKLSEIDQVNARFYQDHASSYKAELEDLDHRFQTGLASCQRRDFVTSHAAFSYLAKRYELTQIPIAGLAEEDPSPSKLAEIVTLIREKNITSLFLEAFVGNPKLIETIAHETGAKILVLSPPEDISNENIGKTYISRMMENLENLRIALVCL